MLPDRGPAVGSCSGLLRNSWPQESGFREALSVCLDVYRLCGWWQQKGCKSSCFLGLVVGDLGTPRFLFLPWRLFIPPAPEGSVAVSHTRLVFSVIFTACGSRVSFDRTSCSFPLHQRAGNRGDYLFTQSRPHHCQKGQPALSCLIVCRPVMPPLEMATC